MNDRITAEQKSYATMKLSSNRFKYYLVEKGHLFGTLSSKDHESLIEHVEALTMIYKLLQKRFNVEHITWGAWEFGDLEHFCFELSDLAARLHKNGKYYEVIKDVKEKEEDKERYEGIIAGLMTEKEVMLARMSNLENLKLCLKTMFENRLEILYY
ncbi:hypothetical protein QVD17_00800 [Tagetes erecta]|uniref:Uncharacterized protein n=1 Tax=Tagetes erecta TaxID=13708 RepID=A0AAD8LAX1_TARER|nr:hypothetical protein QVD17_00800 [Tagetes erecta]